LPHYSDTSSAPIDGELNTFCRNMNMNESRCTDEQSESGRRTISLLALLRSSYLRYISDI
jgi:hypothetical protein